MNRHQLPVLNGRVAESSLYTDGTRKRIEPAPVHGRFDRARHVVFSALVAIWVLLPVIPMNGHPALFLDIEHRSFFVLGGTFTPTDFWLVFFLATGVGFGLVYATAALGRVWCGWACPQTVFTEVFFRPIDRLTKKKSKWLRHVLYLATSAIVAHVFIAYFVSLGALWRMMLGAPSAHPEAFVWMLALTGAFYGNFAFFREQLCVVLCPYGRLQSVLLDDDSLVIAYDEKRGEPRGKKGKTTGDCVDCRRCVVVCPTGIDIRNGLQMDCIACTACIDACDEVMDKLERPRGLIAYKRGRIVRLRMVLYTVLLAIGAVVFFFATRTRTTFDATLLRQPGAPFTRDASGEVRNGFVVHVVNKSGSPKTYVLEPEPFEGSHYVVPIERAEIAALSDRRIPIFVSAPSTVLGQHGRPKVRVKVRGDNEVRVVEAVFLGGAS
jgi:cytochrome c oxidase accessory protein FixG